jgi:hypothetical protein
MNSILSDIAKFFPTVIAGVIAVEQGVASASGESKKQILITAIDTAAKFGETVGNTQVQLVSTLIDATVGALNTAGIFKTSTPAAPTAAPPATTPAS